MQRAGHACAGRPPRDPVVAGRVGLGAALLAVLCCATSTAAATTPAWIEVLRDDDSGMELLLRAPELQRLDGAARVPGFSSTGEPGLPTLYEAGVLLALPGADGARLEVLEARSRRETALRPEFVPEPLSYSEAHGADPLETRVVRPRAWSGTYPEQVVSLQGTGRLRGRHVAQLRFSPLQYADDGSVSYTRTARVRITFANRARASGSIASDPLYGALLNAATAARWTLQFDSQKSRAQRPRTTQLPDERLRVRIPRTGIFRLPYDRLFAAGVPVDQIDPTTFQLFTDTWYPAALFADSLPASWQVGYELQELAIWIDGEEDHVFDELEEIVFYALGPSEYLDRVGVSSDSLAHAQHPYDNFNYAWLVWNQAPGQRMGAVAVAAPDPSGAVTRTWQRYHFEENWQFRSADDLWIWEEIRDTRPALPRFEIDLGGDLEPVSGTLRVGITNSRWGEWGRHDLIVQLNGETVGNIDWDQPGTRPPNAYFSFPVQLQSANQVQLSIDLGPFVNTSTLLVSLDVAWDRPLMLPATGSPDAGILRWSTRGSGADETFEVAGFGTNQPLALDVSDPARPVRLTNMTAAPGAGRWRMRYAGAAGARTHFAVVSTPSVVPSSDLSRRVLPPLRDLQREVPDMIIVTHSTLRAEALRLASHRAQHYPDDLGRTPLVEVVDVATLYDHFSGGRVDPMAIRNYAKFLYTLGDSLTPPNLRYLMLFGEATHDPRQWLNSTTPTLVPTVHPWYAVPETRREYAVDDWLAEFDGPDPNRALVNVVPLPDVAPGRVTPRTEAEARRIVDKFIAYDRSDDYGAWRTRLILAADDEVTPRRNNEAFHIVNTENLVGLTPDEWDITKTYLTEFPRQGAFKPSARTAFIREWSAGSALINYQGHGAPRTLADEHLFLAPDIPSLVNGARLPVFMAFSCTVSEFDAPELQSMAEDMLTHEFGGAVATMGATTPTFAGPNALYNEQIWREVFVAGAASKVPFGVVHMLGKNKRPEKNNETYVLLGDPSMTLLAPEYIVDLTSGTDSLEAGATSSVRGFVRLPNDPDNTLVFNGVANVEVFASADESGYTKEDDPSFHIQYDVLGAPIYRGSVPVVNGEFRFDFVVPLDARQGNKARVSAYAWNATSGEDAKGGINGIRLVRAEEPQKSRGAPRISMRFPNNITKVQRGTPLIAEIVDENGINIQGTTLLSSILLDFDDSGQQSNVTSLFRYDGSDTSGTLTVPLPDPQEDPRLSPGRHKATLVAFDNLQNRGSENIVFDVVATTSEQLVNVIAFPNPFRDRTHFFFEVTDPSDVTVRVFTSSGREVWRATQFVSEPRQASIPWDGVDRVNDELANGTYLYRVEARPRRTGAADQAARQGPVLDVTGKVVIMRD